MIGSFHFIPYLIIRQWITETCSFFNHFFNFFWNGFSINANTNILKLIGISIFTISNDAIVLLFQSIKQVIRLRLKSRNSIDCRFQRTISSTQKLYEFYFTIAVINRYLVIEVIASLSNKLTFSDRHFNSRLFHPKTNLYAINQNFI